MDIGATFVAHPEAAKLTQPRDCAFDHPPINAQTAAMFGVAPRQDGLDAPPAQRPAMGLGIVGSIPLHAIRSVPRMADLAPDRRNGINQRNQLSNVVGIGAGQYRRQRNPLRFQDHMMLAARFAPIRRIGAGLLAAAASRSFPIRSPSLGATVPTECRS
jgi:hypothetical protein